MKTGRFDREKTIVLETTRKLVEKGYLTTTGGNLSVRTEDGNQLAITPSDYDYTKMTTEDICILDFQGRQIEGRLKPSIESGIHLIAYQLRPDVHVITHTHQIYASALTVINKPIPALFDEQARFLGRAVDIIPYAPSGTSFLRNKVARYIRNKNNAYLLQNHGALIFGRDPQRAIHNVEILEKCSIAYLLALCSEQKISKIPLVIREIAFAKLRQDQKNVERIMAQDFKRP